MSTTAATRPTTVKQHAIAHAAAMLCVMLALSYTPNALADLTSIDNEPLATRPAVKAKPNLLFMLDDSGSMTSSFMPDDIGYSDIYGYRSAQCNGVAYDPTVTYTPRVNADGSSMGNASFPSGTQYYYLYNGNNGVKQPKMGWAFTATAPVNNTFYEECKIDTDTSTAIFTKVTVTSSSAEAQNYANWYKYYRTRRELMRTAMGLAMKGLDDTYRIGFATIHEDTFVASSSNFYFVDVADFNSAQKTKFYDSLYKAGGNSATPLRAALSDAGLYFGNKHTGQTDPVQYSCQRNYTLLSTDGYWNGSTKGVQLDTSTAVGQQDGMESRPMRDSATVSDVVTTTYLVTETRNKTVTSTRTYTWDRTKTVVSSTAKTTDPNKGQYKVTTTPQTYSTTQTQTVITPQTRTYTLTVTVTTPEGGTATTKESKGTASAWVDGTPGAPSISPASVTTPTDSNTWTNGTAVVTYQTAKGSGVATYSAITASASSPSAWTVTNTAYTTESEASRDQTGDPVTSQTSSGGASDTLADVAEYYWKTDIRNSKWSNCTSSASGASRDVCNDIVPTTSQDPATYQHMNTYTIGLGVSGTLSYDKNYLTQTSGTYVDLKNGTINWPKPTENEATAIDDLWHAAVNGRGQYYSAMDASALKDAIAGVIASITRTDGASSAAATSSLELVAGDNNRLYRASYTTSAWTGDLTAYKLTGSTASVSSTVVWSAQALLDAKTYTDRKIYFNKSGVITAFNADNLTTAQLAYFKDLCSKAVLSSQCSSLTGTALTKANTAANLVNYLRGERTYESATKDGTTDIAALYRKREHILGDIVNGAPVYVGKPPFSYADSGYSTFASTARDAMIYVAANDGMLHAFDAATGEEKWAFIPSEVMPSLYKLADTSYGTKHQYFVDGAPVMGDIKVDGAWKTILVGGLNKGGKAYYALDITDPTDPKVLWEFSHANLGLSYGNPIITKNKAGKWIVAFASGYNNYDSSTSTGDGKGRLFIVDAATGTEVVTGGIPTAAGSTATPSGLAKINAWIDDASNNTATRFYGGDLLGNVWRFDFDGLVEPKNAALKLGVGQISSTSPQPITTKPMLIQASGKPVVIVGTGKYLGESDITDTTQQSIYAIKDPLTNDSWGDIRNNSNFVKQTLTIDSGGKTASITTNSVDWSSKAGWWVDLPHSKERVSTQMALQLTTLVVPTTIPNGDACSSGGSSWLYYLNAATGGTVNKNPVGAQQSDHTLLVGTNWVRDSDGNIRLIVQDSSGKITTETPPVSGASGTGTAHRTSWRELVD